MRPLDKSKRFGILAYLCHVASTQSLPQAEILRITVQAFPHMLGLPYSRVASNLFDLLNEELEELTDGK